MPKPSTLPAWVEPSPPQGSYRSIFKWGAPSRFHHPKAGLVGYLQDRLSLKEDNWQHPRQIGMEPLKTAPCAPLDTHHVERLTAVVGAENVQIDDFSRVRYAHGQSAEEGLELRNAAPTVAAGVVIHPRHKDDIVQIVAYCHSQRIPITVYSGGSSVTLGVCPVHGGVTLVMTTHMNRVLAFNETNQTITVEPGIMGPAYEDYLYHAPEHFNAQRRYTGGHFPQSFEFSTVGGWIAALGAGQQSTYYGDMYHLVISQEYVTPNGQVATDDFPATATGPKVNDIMKGSEGAFGVLTSATLKIFRCMPENRRQFAFMLPNWDAAVSTVREICQGEFGLPAMLRISDAEETEAALYVYGLANPWVDRFLHMRRQLPKQRCLLLGQCDGGKGFTRHVARRCKAICHKAGGLWLSSYPVKRWAHSRFLDPYMRDDLFDMGVLIDTLETSVTWDKLMAVHTGVRNHIKSHPHTVCMTHASHFYPQGTNLYFIFVTPLTDVDTYRRFQRGIIETIVASGGSLSHHHGVGKMMGPWMASHLGAQQMAVLKALKRHFDPHNIMNPGGTLGLDLISEEK